MAKSGYVWDGSAWVPFTAPVGAVPNAISAYSSVAPSSPQIGQIWNDVSTNTLKVWSGSVWISYASTSSPTFTGTVSASVLNVSTKLIAEQSMTIALSDETTSITTGTSKLTMRAPFAMTLTKIPRASINTASTSGLPTVDINKNGISIFSTTLSIDVNEKTSVTAATAAVLAGGTTSFADDDEITFDIDTAGTGTKGLKVTLYYRLT